MFLEKSSQSILTAVDSCRLYARLPSLSGGAAREPRPTLSESPQTDSNRRPIGSFCLGHIVVKLFYPCDLELRSPPGCHSPGFMSRTVLSFEGIPYN